MDNDKLCEMIPKKKLMVGILYNVGKNITFMINKLWLILKT